MSLLFSTGLKNSIAVALKAVFDGGAIHVYSGPPPTSPDLAPTGTWLGSVTRNGEPYESPSAGLMFETSGQYLYKPASDQWRLVVRDNGQLGWWRLVAQGDDPEALGFNTQRIDGVIGEGNPAVPPHATMWLPTTNVFIGDSHIVEYFMHTTPPVPE